MGARFTIFDAATSALSTASLGISIAGQNISNVNTPGYSKQTASLITLTPQSAGGVEIGRGVKVNSVTNSRDSFAELSLQKAESSQGKSEASSESLLAISEVFNEIDKDGLAKFMDDFFNAWQDLSNEPESTSARLNVLSKGEILSDRFNALSESLTDARENIDIKIKAIVNEVNNLATQIANITSEIKSTPGDSLALRDQRQYLVRQLANFVDVSTVENSDDDFQVYIGTGVNLVTDTTANTLGVQANISNDGLFNITIAVGSGSPQDISGKINSGQLKGLLDVRDSKIPSYQDELDELAYELVDEVNTLHAAGYDLDGDTGNNFFGSLAAIADSAANISLSATVDGNPDEIAASSTLAGIPGNNTQSLAIASLVDNTITFTSKSTTFGFYYGDLLTEIGSDTNLAINEAIFSEDVLAQAETNRERISGVSLEEEQLDLIRFQSHMQAAARLVQVAADVLQTLVELG